MGNETWPVFLGVSQDVKVEKRDRLEKPVVSPSMPESSDEKELTILG